MKYQGTIFDNKTVTLDDNEFDNCIFNNCELVYQGGVPPKLSNNLFNSGRIVFRGPAADTVAFVKAMAAPNSGMQKLVHSTFPEIFGK